MTKEPTSSHLNTFDESEIVGKPYQKGDWTKIATHDDKVIHGFFGPYRFLSNMWPCSVMVDRHSFPSVENAYQAAKFEDDLQLTFLSLSPEESKKVSRMMTMKYSSDEWNALRLSIMLNCLESKFTDPELRVKLLATKPKHLAETNWWGDQFWGCDKEGVGENQLGILLMQIRDELLPQ